MQDPLAILFYLVIIAVIAGLVVFAVIQSSKQTKALNDVFSRLAARFGGSCDKPDWSGRPRARFVHNGANVLVDIYSTGGKHPKHFTQVHVGWPDGVLRCEIYPATFLTQVGKFLGMHDVEIGDKAFDDAYQIRGHDPAAIKAFMSAGVRSAILDIRRFGGNDQIYVLVSGGTLLVKKFGIFRQFDELARLVVLGLELYEQALLASGGGIEFVDFPTPGHGPPTCQVCGEEIVENLVNCKSCKTPHHKDCWTYSGACSTYGCGQKKFVTMRSAG